MIPVRTTPVYRGTPLKLDYYPQGTSVDGPAKSTLYWDVRGPYSSCIDVGKVPWSLGLRIVGVQNFESTNEGELRMWAPDDGPLTALAAKEKPKDNAPQEYRWKGSVEEARQAHLQYVRDAATRQIKGTFDPRYAGWIVWDIENSEPDTIVMEDYNLFDGKMRQLADLVKLRSGGSGRKMSVDKAAKFYRAWQKDYYSTVIAATRAACPQAKIGFYGFGGLNYLHTQTAETKPALMPKAHRERLGREFRPGDTQEGVWLTGSERQRIYSDRYVEQADWLYDLVDGIFPSMYLPYPSTDKTFINNGNLEAHNGYSEEQRKAWAAKYGVWPSPNIDVDPQPDGSLRGYVVGKNTYYSHGLVTRDALEAYFYYSIQHSHRLGRRAKKRLPVYPYVWLHYHDNNKLRGVYGPTINDWELRLIFERPLSLGCKGVVLWDWLGAKPAGDPEYQNCYDHADRMRLDMLNRVNPYLENLFAVKEGV